MQKRLLAIVGPTAVGKSALALMLADHFDGEIVSVDSRKVYRKMDIGTAKPSTEDLSATPHHLIDVVEPNEPYSLALFLKQAASAIDRVHSRGRLPVLAGGTGQYVRALLEGWQVPSIPPDPALRRRLEDRARSEGARALHSELARTDPAAAVRVDPRNVRRVVRALEVSLLRGETSSDPRKAAPRYRTMTIGLTQSREALYQRIDDRVDRMMASGWIDEVRGLLDMGYSQDLPSMSGVGYGELAMHLTGILPIEDAVRRTKYRTHRFARNQYAWFRLDDPVIRWFDTAKGYAGPMDTTREWLRR